MGNNRDWPLAPRPDATNDRKVIKVAGLGVQIHAGSKIVEEIKSFFTKNPNATVREYAGHKAHTVQWAIKILAATAKLGTIELTEKAKTKDMDRYNLKVTT
jgi:hypothetical protein